MALVAELCCQSGYDFSCTVESQHDASDMRPGVCVCVYILVSVYRILSVCLRGFFCIRDVLVSMVMSSQIAHSSVGKVLWAAMKLRLLSVCACAVVCDKSYTYFYLSSS